jgi:hypothetical protein
MSSTVRNLFAMLLSLVLASAVISVRNACAAQQHPAAASAHTASIACRVMERHVDKEHGIILILFHQRDKPDQPRLKDFLVHHDGGTIEIQTGSADWQKVTVWRIRSCFGRGLFAVPDNAAPTDKATFKIRAVQ